MLPRGTALDISCYFRIAIGDIPYRFPIVFKTWVICVRSYLAFESQIRTLDDKGNLHPNSENMKAELKQTTVFASTWWDYFRTPNVIMKDDLQEESDGEGRTVKYGIIFIIIIQVLIVAALCLIKIDGETILESIINYSFE